jgi:hypothetical protein
MDQPELASPFYERGAEKPSPHHAAERFGIQGPL